MRLAVALLAAVVAFALRSHDAGAAPRPADCELTVNGRTYIRGQCQFDAEADGSFRINGQDYFAYVNVTAPGVADASWNADPASTHAHTRIGEVRRQGACWVGANARICARALPPEALRTAQAAQPDGFALWPITPGLTACIGPQGALAAGTRMVLRNCRVPADLLVQRGPDGALTLSSNLCLGIEAPGMGRPAELIAEPCAANSPRWTSQATSTEEAVVRSSEGMCLTIPAMARPETPFPYTVNVAPCAATATKFILSRG